MKTISELIPLVQQWAKNKGIYKSSTALKQLDKASEEFNELQQAAGAIIAARNANIRLGSEMDSMKSLINFERANLKDAYGDVLVCLINAAYLHNIDLNQALNEAYNTIINRKGKMINGKFVKQ